jgi:hypothetical protein
MYPRLHGSYDRRAALTIREAQVRDVRFSIRSATVAGLVAAVALAGQTAASAAGGAAAGGAATAGRAQPAAPARPAGGPGQWTPVTGAVPITSDIGLVRGTDHILHVIWDTGATGHMRIMDTPIRPSGGVAAMVTIASGFGSVADPDATAVPGGLDVFWNGIKNLDTGTPLGTFSAIRPPSGGKWSLGPVVPPLSRSTFLGTDSAGTGGDGKPWVAFTGTDWLGLLHIGHPETRIPPTACCVYQPGIATDGVSHATYIAYLSLINKGQGIWVQRLSQTGAAGRAVRLPGSQTGGNVISIAQRVGITGRGPGHAGVYVAYINGYPITHALDVLKLGASRPTVVATVGGANEIQGSTITAGPDHRLWAAWVIGRGSAPALFVRASDVNGGNWGRTVRVPLPSGATTLWKVYANAQAGRVDLVVLMTRNGHFGWFATQRLLPPPPPKKKAAAATTASVITARGGAAATTAAAAASQARPAAPSWHIVKQVPNGARQNAFTAVVATGRTTAMAFQGNAGVLEPAAWVLRGGAWRKTSFPGRNDEEVMNAAATSPNDVWAFTEGFTSHTASGVLSRVLHWNGRAWSVVKTFGDIISEGREAAPNDVWVFGEGAQDNAFYFNGRTWTFEGSGVNGGSVLAASDAWGYTGTFVEHWSGHKWVATNVAKLLPPHNAGNDPAVTGIIALRAGNVYAIANGFSSSSACGPTIVLHFNGIGWGKAATGSFGCGPLNQLISPDGRGGLWLPMPDIAALPSYLVHYSGGRLTRAVLPGGFLTYTVSDAATLPGTARALAVGFRHPSGSPSQSLASVILQFS